MIYAYANDEQQQLIRKIPFAIQYTLQWSLYQILFNYAI